MAQPQSRRALAKSGEQHGEQAVPQDNLRLGERAYNLILQGLFDGKVAPGAFVSQNDLVKLYDIPIQPLRDALRVLEGEGVVIIHPRSGIQFLKPDMELARSTYQFRTIIERAAVRTFAETGARDDIDLFLSQHHELIEKIESDGLNEEEHAALESLDHRLHAAMIASLRNPLIEVAARRLKNYVTLIGLDRLRTKPLALRTMREHVAILEACRDRDASKAEEALAVHFQSALYRILGL